MLLRLGYLFYGIGHQSDSLCLKITATEGGIIADTKAMNEPKRCASGDAHHAMALKIQT